MCVEAFLGGLPADFLHDVFQELVRQSHYVVKEAKNMLSEHCKMGYLFS
jgi:hypothetical protein